MDFTFLILFLWWNWLRFVSVYSRFQKKVALKFCLPFASLSFTDPLPTGQVKMRSYLPRRRINFFQALKFNTTGTCVLIYRNIQSWINNVLVSTYSWSTKGQFSHERKYYLERFYPSIAPFYSNWPGSAFWKLMQLSRSQVIWNHIKTTHPHLQPLLFVFQEVNMIAQRRSSKFEASWVTMVHVHFHGYWCFYFNIYFIGYSYYRNNRRDIWCPVSV